MITGRVSLDGREAVVFFDMLGRDGQSRRIEAVIDTGFTGYLTLPADVTNFLRLPRRGSEMFLLADGSEVVLPIYRGRIFWHGTEFRIPVIRAEGAALVGMSLLRGNLLTVDAVPGGEVRIEERH